MGAFRILPAGSTAGTGDAGRGTAGAAGRAVSAADAAGSRLRGLDDGPASSPIPAATSAPAIASVGPPPPPPTATMTPPSAGGGKASLADLTGVRPSDGETERGRVRRDHPRLAFTPTHALGAILLLAAALSASLTMLLNQAIRYETALSAANAATRVAGDDAGVGSSGSGGGRSDASAGERTSPDEAGASSSDDSAGTATDGAGTTGDGGDSGGGEPNANEGNPPPAEAAAPDDGRIDLNTATSDELQTINGIGPVTAGRIIDYRTQHGRFDNVDQLLDVKGIGTKTLAKIRDQVTVR